MSKTFIVTKILFFVRVLFSFVSDAKIELKLEPYFRDETN